MAGEANLQTRISTCCKKLAILCFKLDAAGQRGFPDLLLLKDSKIVFIELKNPNGHGRLSAPQTRMIEKFKKEKVNIYVVENFEQFEAIKKRYYN